MKKLILGLVILVSVIMVGAGETRLSYSAEKAEQLSSEAYVIYYKKAHGHDSVYDYDYSKDFSIRVGPGIYIVGLHEDYGEYTDPTTGKVYNLPYFCTVYYFDSRKKILRAIHHVTEKEKENDEVITVVRAFYYRFNMPNCYRGI